MATAAKMPMIATTIINSTRVKPPLFLRALIIGLPPDRVHCSHHATCEMRTDIGIYLFDFYGKK
jgi:hypothetical protein